MDLSKPIQGLWGYESYNRIEQLGFITLDLNVCPNPLPPPVLVEPEPEPPLTPVIITPVTLEETSNDYVFFILLCMVLSLVICGYCAGMLYKKN